MPRSNVYDWARKDLVVPSISPERQMLWSYADLMTLRIVSWLRHPKHLGEDAHPGAAMKSVRQALSQLGSRGLDVWSDAAGVSPLFVDRKGGIYIVDGIGRTDEGFLAIDVRTYDEEQMSATGEPLVIGFDHVTAITVF